MLRFRGIGFWVTLLVFGAFALLSFAGRHVTSALPSVFDVELQLEAESKALSKFSTSRSAWVCCRIL